MTWTPARGAGLRIAEKARIFLRALDPLLSVRTVHAKLFNTQVSFHSMMSFCLLLRLAGSCLRSLCSRLLQASRPATNVGLVETVAESGDSAGELRHKTLHMYTATCFEPDVRRKLCATPTGNHANHSPSTCPGPSTCIHVLHVA